MSTDDIVRHLALTHFLRGQDEEGLRQLAESLDLRRFEAGETVLPRGEPLDGLHLILRGEVELLAEDPDGRSLRVGREEMGALLGAFELLSGRATDIGFRALQPSEIIFWDKASLFRFLEANPPALESLQLTASTQVLDRQLSFEWIGQQEAIFALARKHVAHLFARLVVPAFLALVAAAVALWALSGGALLLLWLAGALAAAGAALALWHWIDWRNDYYLVTDQRVVWIEKVVAIYDSQVEAPLHQILSVSVSSDMLGRWLGFGDVIIRTFTGQIVFKTVGRPRAIAAVVEERWRRLQIEQRDQDRATKLEAVRSILDDQEPVEAADQAPEAMAEPPVEGPETSRETGLNHWNFELRFEEEGVITYRKHWAVLLNRIGAPSIVLLLLGGLTGARLSDLTELLPLGAFLATAAGLAAATLLWWIYGYLDWANDIYQVSPTHILDVYRKPLGRELRRAAPLENILSTEVDRRGIVGLVLDYGEVRVNVGTEQLDFTGVFHPRLVQQDIVRAQEAFLAQKREGEKRQRRHEMVEWLGVYHDELTSNKAKPSENREQDDYP